MSKEPTDKALDAACLVFARTHGKANGELNQDELRRRVEDRRAASNKLLKAALARAAELEATDASA